MIGHRPAVPCRPARSWRTRKVRQGLEPLNKVRMPDLPPTSRDGRKLGRTCPADPNTSLPAEDLNAMAPELPVVMPSGPFRHVGMSKAARTHRLRKLRTPAKCRECNSYVYFQGAECEEVRVPTECTVWGAASKEAVHPGADRIWPGPEDSRQGRLVVLQGQCLPSGNTPGQPGAERGAETCVCWGGICQKRKV